MYHQIPGLIQNRRIAKKHAEADCDFIFNDQWLKECQPAFFYGVAHILKHQCGMRASDMLLDNDFSSENKIALARTVGWADEFYWLAHWMHTRRLQGPLMEEDYKSDPYELFFQALIQTEWGDLLRDALFFLRKELVDETPSENSDRFGVWEKEDNRDLQTTVFERAHARFSSAKLALTKGSPDHAEKELREVRSDVKRHLHSGLARIFHSRGMYDEAKLHLEMAISLVRGDRPILIKLLKNFYVNGVDLDELSLWRKKEIRKPRASIHILAGWIEDLLVSKVNSTLHPRLSLEKKGIKKSVTSFPNLDTIDRLVGHLGDNLGWLRFVTQNGKDYINRINKIEHRNQALAGMRMRDKKEPPAPEYFWKFFVLRDWGSYTPLLPRTMKGKLPQSSGGGGYFLQYGDKGVVIDPGFDYIKHFFEAKLDPDLITHVIVTHDHYDHTSSLGPLLNLLYMRKQKLSLKKKPGKVKFYLSRGVFDQYARFIVDYQYFANIKPLTDQDKKMSRRHILSGNPRVELITTHVEHGDKNGFGNGVGLLFKFQKNIPSIGVTSDTGWYESWVDERDEEINLGEAFNKYAPQVLVLHVGSIKKTELQDSGFYKTHLGARGVFRTIDEIKSCQLAVLSEFGEECQGHRGWFADKISKHFYDAGRRDFRCFPSDSKTCVAAKGKELVVSNINDSSSESPYSKAMAKETNGRIVFKKPKRSAPRKKTKGQDDEAQF